MSLAICFRSRQEGDSGGECKKQDGELVQVSVAGRDEALVDDAAGEEAARGTVIADDDIEVQPRPSGR